MDQSEEMRAVVLKAWSDSDYKHRLIANPREALGEVGIPTSSGRTIKIIEDTEDTIHVVLPLAPRDTELDDEVLDAIAGGGPLKGVTFTSSCTRSSCN